MKLHRVDEFHVAFHCPGCSCAHVIPVVEYSSQRPAWTWNGSLDAPTFIPSLLIRSGHYAPSAQTEEGICWCTYNREHPEKPTLFTCGVCHSFVTNGQVNFLTDSTHHLAGRTVTLPEWEDE